MSVRHPESSSGTLRSLSLVAVAFLVVVIAVAGVASYKDLQAARARQAKLEERVTEARGLVEVLERRVERLADDPQTLERLAREELGLVRPGDVVVVLPEGEPPERLRPRP